MVTMTALYFLAGSMARATGSFDLAKLGGLYAAKPLLAALAMILLFAVSALPPFSGFWPKAMMVRAAIAQGSWWIASAILLSGFLMTFVAGRIILLAFWRPATPGNETGPVSPTAVNALIALSALVVAAGIWPQPFFDISASAAAGLLDRQSYIGSVFPGGRP
jgi:multicomponent Na+:H+ antiporter subunit D